MTRLQQIVHEQQGQTLVEYTLMIGLVVLIIWLAMDAAGINDVVSTVWGKVRSRMPAY